MKLAFWLYSFLALQLHAQRIDSGSASDFAFTGGATQTIAALPHDQTVRYGDFSYTLPCPDSQPRLVTFGFIEPSQKAAGLRLFRVELNDQVMFDRLDLYAIAGYQVPLARRVIAHCADDWLKIGFKTQARSAVVSWIDVQIAPGSAPGTAALKQVVERFVVPAVPIEQKSFTLTLAKTPATGTVVLAFLRSSQALGDAIDANTSNGSRQVTILFPDHEDDKIVLVYWTLE